jgi:hypothetical protein
MLNLSSATRVFVATTPVDLRGSFNRLAALTQSVLAQDPLSGHWFVFTNRRRHQMTFNIPIRHRRHRVSLASTARTAAVCGPAKGTERDRGH